MPGEPSIVVVTEDLVSTVTVQQPLVQVVQVATPGPQGPPGSGGASALNDLIDVTISSPASGQLLSYNGSQWVNQAASLVGSLDDLSDVSISAPASA